eukprot:344517-Chlamydomonas_euryale.AAC.9
MHDAYMHDAHSIVCMQTDRGATTGMQVARFRELFKELLSMEHEVNMHTQALQTMKGTYQPANESSDFKGLLDKKIKALLQSHRFEPEAANELKDFDAGTGGGVAADDDVVEDGAGDLPYDRCPLTGKSVSCGAVLFGEAKYLYWAELFTQDMTCRTCAARGCELKVFDLEDPVADQKGVIYEKAVVVDYIKKKLRAGHDAVCPVAGARHVLIMTNLTKPTALERAKRRQMLNKGNAAAQQENVYDADDA